jgi:hypothetical protein
MATLRLQYGDEEAEVEFSEEEMTILERFLRHARRIEACPVVQMGMPFSFRIGWEENGPTSVTVSLPEWSLVELYLYRLRPILLKKERTNFDKVCGILSRKFTLPAIANAIGEERKLYRGANIEATLKISSNVDGTDVLLTSDTVLNDYLYGLAEYHDDERRRKNFECLYVMFPTELGQALCLWLLQEKGGAILRMAEFVRGIVDTYRGVTTQPIRADLLAFKVGAGTPQQNEP